MTEKTLTDAEQTEREEFEKMAKAAESLVADAKYDQFRSLLEFLLKINQESLDIITNKATKLQEVKTPEQAATMQAQIQAQGLQAANISGQNQIIRVILDTPQKFIRKWDEYKKLKHIEEE